VGLYNLIHLSGIAKHHTPNKYSPRRSVSVFYLLFRECTKLAILINLN